MERRRALEEPAKDGPAKVILSHSGVLARLMCYGTGLGQDVEAVRKGFGLCGDGVTVARMPTVVPTLRSHVVFDSVCMHSGRYVFAEVQQSPGAKGYLAKREEFYRGVAIVNQQGREFSGDDYGVMAESVFFWIVVSPRKADRGTVRRSSFGSSLSLPAEIVEINICHPDEVEGDDYLRFFCTLFYPFIGFEDRKRRLKEESNFEFDESMDDCLKEMSHMGYQDEVLSGLLMTERCEGIDEGLEKGRAEGLEAGMEKGRAEEVLDYVRTVRGMRAKGLSLDDAMGLVPERIAEDVRSALAESDSS